MNNQQREKISCITTAGANAWMGHNLNIATALFVLQCLSFLSTSYLLVHHKHEGKGGRIVQYLPPKFWRQIFVAFRVSERRLTKFLAWFWKKKVDFDKQVSIAAERFSPSEILERFMKTSAARVELVCEGRLDPASKVCEKSAKRRGKETLWRYEAEKMTSGCLPSRKRTLPVGSPPLYIERARQRAGLRPPSSPYPRDRDVLTAIFL